MKKGSVVVFGGAGFIGSHLSDDLVKSNEYSKVYSFDLRDPAKAIDGVEYIRGDVRERINEEIFRDVVKVYNFAAVHTTPGHPDHEYYETNVLGALNICDFCRRAGVQEIVFTSSISVYGPSEDRKSEDSKPAPISAYGWSKLLAERIHEVWLSESDLRSLIVCRPAVIFGHREGGNFARLAKLLKKGFFIFPGRKDTIKACYYVKHLISAFKYAESKKSKYILFNASYKDRYTLEKIVNEIELANGRKVLKVLFPKISVLLAANILRPMSIAGLGIHPDRVLKLIRSTDIQPNWLTSEGISDNVSFEAAIQDWKAETSGQFD
ncbi:NAD-dependent epimerase/dehydratase family protein [Pannonibacter phragmitetus]|uniref:NAD-dependent epimerase/dehydratase family protein n=1 Tax=Pannonibacter phragmitetus TaxID=121719 RepID=UPI000B95D78F|nr:NAD(P)-dependent oxidoreductase [Pannonibacter phragmitetus]